MLNQLMWLILLSILMPLLNLIPHSVSFHNLFVVLVVEDFDVLGHSDSFHPDFEKVILLLHLEGIPPLLHFDVF